MIPHPVKVFMANLVMVLLALIKHYARIFCRKLLLFSPKPYKAVLISTATVRKTCAFE